jgi:hypothetical protein
MLPLDVNLTFHIPVSLDLDEPTTVVHTADTASQLCGHFVGGDATAALPL